MNKIVALNYFGAYLGVTENWAYKMLKAIPDVRVVIASKCYLKNDFYPEDFDFLRIPGQKIFNLRPENRVLAAGATLLRESMGFLYAYLLSNELRGKKVDLLHSHYAYYAWDVRLLPKKHEIPHIVSLYGFDYESILHRYPVWKARQRRLFELADAFLCEGHNGKRILARMGCPDEKIFVNELGVEVDKIPFYLRPKKTNELKLIQIARITEKKGHIYTIRAFIRALKKCAGLTLTVIGSDVEGIKKSLLRELDEAKATEKVQFVDSIPLSQIHAIMKNYHIFIHPSCYAKDRDCEGGAPFVFLDAQATGMPVISTTHCDIPDEVKHGQTGILCPEKDVEGLKDAIEKFYHMGPMEYANYAKAARAHIERRYDVRENAKQLRQVYEEVLSRHRNT